jgi:protein tyrosine/serine phosphatase
MTENISISLSNVKNIKTVNIEGIGVFQVRKLGAGAELDLSDKLRRLDKIVGIVKSLDFTSHDPTTEEGKAELEKIQAKAIKLMDEVGEIRRFELETYKSCFTDDNNGKNTKKLFDILSDEERVELFKQIFNPVVPIDPKSNEMDQIAEES